MSDKTELTEQDLNLIANMDERLKKLETLLDEALAKETPESLTQWLLSKRSIAPIEQVEQPKEEVKERWQVSVEPFAYHRNDVKIVISLNDGFISNDGGKYLAEKIKALLAVDEIIQLRKGYFSCENPMNDEAYWQEVKNHLKAL